MTVALILAGVFVASFIAFVGLCVYALCRVAHDSDELIERTMVEPFEEVDAVIFEFPQRRAGGGWVA